jgi:hypothetical protein
VRTLILLALGFAAFGAEVPPVGFVHGEFVGWSGTVKAGELTVRSGPHLYSCRFDASTYFARDDQSITAAGIDAGERLEVLADRAPGAGTCYARTVQVIEPVVIHRYPGMRPVPPAAPRPTTDLFLPRGNLTFAGIVVRIDPGLLTLHTMREGRKLILVRPDTRFISSGIRADAASLKPGTQVFVRAGHDLFQRIEAYQIVWGEIAGP